MVVIAIIAILLGISSLKFRSPRPIEAAQVFSSVADLARVEALRSGTRSRVAIQVDSSDGENHLRQVVALIDKDGDLQTEDWVITSIKRLPEGTILSEDFTGSFTGDEQVMDIDTDNLGTQAADGRNFFFHEFNSLGQCESSFQWVFTSGFVEGSDVSIPNESDLDGFIIRKTGKSTFFSQPDQITEPSQS